MNALVALIGVFALAAIALLGTMNSLSTVFGTVIPGLAVVIFVVGVIARIVSWARTAVPFRVTTTCGQQKSLPWIKHSKLDCPYTKTQTFWRMALEVLFFRSLFRNTQAGLAGDATDRRLVYGSSKYLWLGAIVFHYCFLVVIIRHFRFFYDPVPAWVQFIERLDGFLQIGVPGWYLTSIGLTLGLLYLLFRRFTDPKVRFMSLPADYFALFLLLGIAISGGVLRYTPLRTDIVGVKDLVSGLWSFSPVALEGAHAMFFIHLFLVCVLLAYFPFSKLMHAGGIFFSPTRNLPNDNRARRHVNPWADEIPQTTHTYDEWEEEFADVMKAAGMKLDKET
ncbi:MAG: sulfate reduction electron transfer complex DsrMKJOP subunit DsrM [bacterium]